MASTTPEFASAFASLLEEQGVPLSNIPAFTAAFDELVQEWTDVNGGGWPDTRLALQISELVAHWTASKVQFRAWWSGPADGGFDITGAVPGGGHYVLTDGLGNERFLPSPAKLVARLADQALEDEALADLVAGYTASYNAAVAANTEAQDNREAAELALATSITARADTLEARDDAQAAEAGSVAARSGAEAALAELSDEVSQANAHRLAAAASATAAQTAETNAETAEQGALTARQGAEAALGTLADEVEAAETAAANAAASEAAAEADRATVAAAVADAFAARDQIEGRVDDAEAAAVTATNAAAAAQASAASITDEEANAAASAAAAAASEDAAADSAAAAAASAASVDAPAISARIDTVEDDIAGEVLAREAADAALELRVDALEDDQAADGLILSAHDGRLDALEAEVPLKADADDLAALEAQVGSSLQNELSSLRSDLIRYSLEFAALRSNQFGTRYGYADTFNDADGIDAAASSNEVFTGGTFYGGGAGLGGFSVPVQTPATGLNFARRLNGIWVAGGTHAGGDLLSSPDGDNWTARDVPGAASNAVWRGAAFGGGIFFAVGNGVTATSGDGIVWTLRVSGSPSVFFATAYGAGLFVMANDGGNIFTSGDGIALTDRGVPNGFAPWLAFKFDAGTFLAVGNDGRGMTSPDGIAWTPRPMNAGTRHLYACDYGNGRWVAVGDAGAIVFSNDLQNWTQAVNPYPGFPESNYRSVNFANGQWLAGTSDGRTISSTDGETWVAVENTFGATSLNYIGANGSELLVAMGNGKVSRAIASNGPMELRSAAIPVDHVPTKASLILLAKPRSGSPVFTPNVSISGEVSRNDGGAWVAANLTARETVGGFVVLEDLALDLSALPAGQILRWRSISTGDYAVEVTAAALRWD